MICINTDSSSSGIGVYAKVMAKVVGEDNILSFVMDRNKRSLEYPGNVVMGMFPPGGTGWQFNSRFYRAIFRVRGLKVPEFAHYLSPFLKPSSRTKGIVTIHDLYHLYRKKKHEGYIARLFDIYKKWENIISISNVTKEDLLKIGADEGNITVIHHSMDEKFWVRANEEDISRTKEKYHIPESRKIVLTVGDGIGKNNDVVRKATQGKYFHIHVGRDIKADINLIGVSDKDLVSLYSASDILCRPSSYEGFGRPPLESLFCGTPSVVSDIPIYREILDEAGTYSDITPQGISNAIEEALGNKDEKIKIFNNKYRAYYSMPRFIKQMSEYYSKHAE